MTTDLPPTIAPMRETAEEITKPNDELRIIRLIVAGFAVYCLFVLAVKWLGFSAAGFDHAKEIYHAQEMRWVYDAANPPLYTWLLHGFQQFFGVRLAAVLILNNVLLFLIFLASFVLARRVFGAALPAALAAWSLMLVGQYHKFLYTMSHSLLAAIFCPLLLWLMLRIADERRLGDYAAAGVVLGLGMLSKFLFLAAFLAAVVAALCMRPARRGLLDPRMAATLGIAAAIFTPFVIVSHEHWTRFVTVFRARTGTSQVSDFFASRGDGILSLSTSVGEYGAALALVAVLAVLWARRERSAAPGNTVLPKPRTDELRFVGYTVLAALALLLAAVFAGGVSIIKPRFIHIFLYALPILAVAAVMRYGSGAAALRRFGVLLAVVGAGILAVRVVNSMPVCMNRCEDLTPMDRLARALTQAGFEHGTIFAHGVRLGGNMVLRFPRSRIDVAVDPFVPAAPPAGRRGQCLIVWEEDAVPRGVVPPALAKAAVIRPEQASAKIRSITIDWRWYGITVVDPLDGWRARRTTWHYIFLPDGTDRCR